MCMQATWYLKYRPQTVAELDLADVRESLGNILASGKIPHAFLFSGPRGSGKTSSARILAKAVNCESRIKKHELLEPCNKCESCLSITHGSNVDVVEMDAASNRGIDDARALKENIRLAPIGAKFKVYIIDEAHMLTTEAVNALLKTLEEPPEHAIFVLCTTEKHRLLDTVVSRCVQINFRQPTVAEAVESLMRVVKEEELEADKKTLEMVARAAEGGLRDGRKILEQIYLIWGDLKEEHVRETLGYLETANPEVLLELISGGMQIEALEFVRKLRIVGVPVKVFIERTVGELRGRLLADLTHKDKYLTLIEKMQWAYIQMKETAVEELPLEIAIIELCSGGESQRLEGVKVQMESEKKEVKIDEKLEEKSGKLEDVVARWSEILKGVRPMNHSVEGLLRSTKPLAFDGKSLDLQVYYKFHKDKLESEKCKQIVENVIAKVMGVPKIKLVLTLGHKKDSDIVGKVEEDIVTAAESIFKVSAV